jgi:hypothetical protein
MSEQQSIDLSLQAESLRNKGAAILGKMIPDADKGMIMEFMHCAIGSALLEIMSIQALYQEPVPEEDPAEGLGGTD